MFAELVDRTAETVNELTNGIQTPPQNRLLNGVDNAAMLQMTATPGMRMDAQMLPGANGPAPSMELADMPYHAEALKAQILDNTLKHNQFRPR